MHKTDMKSETIVAAGIVATLSGTTPAVGNIVDLEGVGAATFALATGTVTDAGAAEGISVEIQESDTTADGDFTAVNDDDLAGAAADLQITADTDDDKAIGALGYIGSKRYVRAVATGTTDTDATVAGLWALQRLRYAPPASHAAANIAAT